MLYTKILKVGDCTPINVEQAQATLSEENYQMMMENLAEAVAAHSAVMADDTGTTLEDVEVDDVVGTILNITKEHFPFITLTKSFPKKFMWNIPKEVYQSHKYVVNNNLNILYDPLILFIPLLSDDPIAVMTSYLLKLMELVNGDRESIEGDSRNFMIENGFIKDEEEEETVTTNGDFPPDVIRSMIDDARQYQDDDDIIDDRDIPDVDSVFNETVEEDDSDE
jgi:hypothetical protein